MTAAPSPQSMNPIAAAERADAPSRLPFCVLAGGAEQSLPITVVWQLCDGWELASKTIHKYLDLVPLSKPRSTQATPSKKAIPGEALKDLTPILQPCPPVLHLFLPPLQPWGALLCFVKWNLHPLFTTNQTRLEVRKANKSGTHCVFNSW